MSFIITKEALKILAMNNASCKVFGEKRVKNLKYLTVCAGADKDFDYDDLVANLPEAGLMYQSIKSFAKYLKRDRIDHLLMLKFLGGQWHIQYVKDQIDVVDMKKVFGDDFTNNFLFSHILIVAEIVEIKKHISARYLKGGVNVEIRNLVKHPFIVDELKIGQKVLIHQALILEIEPNDETKRILDAEQSSSKEFMSIASTICVVDYEKFWDVKKWTADILKEL